MYMIDFLFQLFENIVIASGPFCFFYGMGKNQNSGKLLFRNVIQTGPNGLSLTESNSLIYISTTASGVSAIKTCRVAFGTGNNITSDEISGITCGPLSSIVGSRSFSPGSNLSTGSNNGQNLTFGGKNNIDGSVGFINSGGYNIFIGGYANYLNASLNSVILGGCCNTIKTCTIRSSIINSRGSYLYQDGGGSIINSGSSASNTSPFKDITKNKIRMGNSVYGSIINSYIKEASGPEAGFIVNCRSWQSSIIGSTRAQILASQYCTYNNSIISSDRNSISMYSSQGLPNASVKMVSIISSCCNYVYGSYYNYFGLLTKPSQQSSIISSSKSQIRGSSRSSIISTNNSCVSNLEQYRNNYTSLVSNATIISSGDSLIRNISSTPAYQNNYYNRSNSIIGAFSSTITIDDSTITNSGGTYILEYSSIIASKNSQMPQSEKFNSIISSSGAQIRCGIADALYSSIISSKGVSNQGRNNSIISSSGNTQMNTCFSTIISSIGSCIGSLSISGDGTFNSVIGTRESFVSPGSKFSVILSGTCNLINGNANYGVIIGGHRNSLELCTSLNANTTILGGICNKIVQNSSVSRFSQVIASSECSCIGETSGLLSCICAYNSIIGGMRNKISGNRTLTGTRLCTKHSSIIGGEFNEINGSCYTVILGGCNMRGGCICPNFSDTTGITPSNFNALVPNFMFNSTLVNGLAGMSDGRQGRICTNLIPTGGLKIQKGLVIT